VTFSDFYNLESLVLPDSQVHPFYTPSSRPIFGDGGDVRVFVRCYGDVMAVFGDVMAVFGDVRRDYGGTWMTP